MLAAFVEHYSGAMPGVSVPYPGPDAPWTALPTPATALPSAPTSWKASPAACSTASPSPRVLPRSPAETPSAVRKPDAEHLLGTVRLAEADPKRTVMIGDSLNDMLVARNAGVPSIGVPFGYSDVPVADLGTEPCHHPFQRTGHPTSSSGSSPADIPEESLGLDGNTLEPPVRLGSRPSGRIRRPGFPQPGWPQLRQAGTGNRAPELAGERGPSRC